MSRYEEKVLGIPGRPASMIVGNVKSWHEGHDEAKRTALKIAVNADEEIARLRLAVNDWLNTYASDMCAEECVSESRERIFEAGGTLAYIASVLKARP